MSANSRRAALVGRDGWVAGRGASNTGVASAGSFFDKGPHCFDLLDLLVSEITGVEAFALNTGGSYRGGDGGSIFSSGADVGSSNGGSTSTPERCTTGFAKSTIATWSAVES